MGLRGVSFQIPQMEPDILTRILGCIDVESLFWHNVASQDEVFTTESHECFFDEDDYDGPVFAEKIKSPHRIIFLKLQAYPHDVPEPENISSYEAYQKSDCSLILLIYDCEYAELYAKDAAILQSLFDHAVKNGFSNVEFITDENDERYKMDIL